MPRRHTPDGYRRTAELMKALAHPTRLKILELLEAEGEACVCHLEHRLGRRQAYVSQQLSTLRAAGLVVDRRDGLNVFYALSDQAASGLAQRGRLLAQRVAAQEGVELEFGGLSATATAGCPCPKCAEQS